jgi:hypothetical protein
MCGANLHWPVGVLWPPAICAIRKSPQRSTDQGQGQVLAPTDLGRPPVAPTDAVSLRAQRVNLPGFGDCFAPLAMTHPFGIAAICFTASRLRVFAEGFRGGAFCKKPLPGILPIPRADTQVRPLHEHPTGGHLRCPGPGLLGRGPL